MSSHDDLEDLFVDDLIEREWAVRTGLLYADEHGNILGDIDVLAIKGKYCIVAELKSTLTARRMTFAVEQVNRAIRNQPELYQYRIFPLVVTFSNKYHRGWDAYWIHRRIDEEIKQRYRP